MKEYKQSDGNIPVNVILDIPGRPFLNGAPGNIQGMLTALWKNYGHMAERCKDHDKGQSHDDVIEWKHFSALLALSAWNSSVTGKFP